MILSLASAPVVAPQLRVWGQTLGRCGEVGVGVREPGSWRGVAPETL